MYPFDDGPTWVRNAWYVVACDDEIGDAPVGRTVLGEPLVLYRTTDGAVTCLAGVCPHRQYPLDLAQREGDDLRCPYHGMKFAPDGRCVEIPSQERVPDRCRVRSYPIVEQWRWVWVWMGDPALADPSSVPDPGIYDTLHVIPCYRLPVGGRYQLLNENLLDLSHIPYLHYGGGGSAAHWTAETIADDPDGRWQRSTREMTVPSPPRLPAFESHAGRPVHMTLETTWWPPVFHMGRQTYRTLEGEHLGEVRFLHGFTPVDEHATVYFFAGARDFGHGDADIDEMVRARFNAVLDQDKAAIELIEPLVDRPGRAPDVNCTADAGALRGRRAVQAMIDAER